MKKNQYVLEQQLSISTYIEYCTFPVSLLQSIFIEIARTKEGSVRAEESGMSQAAELQPSERGKHLVVTGRTNYRDWLLLKLVFLSLCNGSSVKIRQPLSQCEWRACEASIALWSVTSPHWGAIALNSIPVSDLNVVQSTNCFHAYEQCTWATKDIIF